MSKYVKALFIIVFMLTVPSSFTFNKLDYRKAMNKNVCKTFNNDILVYLIFVDSRYTTPWTEFDIQSTMDSVNTALRWLREKAIDNNIPIKFKTDYYIGDQYATIKKNLPNESVKSTVETKTNQGLNELNKWADNIARKAGDSFYIVEKDGIPEIKKPKNKERLIAFLRDEHAVESVAVLYMVNNYFRSDISIPVNTFTDDDVEFAIVSYKYPSEIAHNILHLFGAADLYKTIYREHDRKIDELNTLFPSDIMQEPYGKNLYDLEIGEYTRYLIGWQENIKPELDIYFTDKFKVFN